MLGVGHHGDLASDRTQNSARDARLEAGGRPPGDDYAISGTWECRRAGDARVLLLDFEGLDDMKTLPLAESYACRARGTGHVLSFRRRGESGSAQRARWNSALAGFVEVVSNATF